MADSVHGTKRPDTDTDSESGTGTYTNSAPYTESTNAGSAAATRPFVGRLYLPRKFYWFWGIGIPGATVYQWVHNGGSSGDVWAL